MSETHEPTDAPTVPPAKPTKRGFAAMDPAKQRELAQAGARKVHANGNAHKFTTDNARDAGVKGGQKTSQDRKHMAAIGRKGGSTTARNVEHMRTIGKKGGAKVAQDRAHMAEIGKKGAAVVNGSPES